MVAIFSGSPRPRRRHRFSAWAFAFGLVSALSLPARAEDAPAAGDARVVVRFSTLSGYPELLGVSASIRPPWIPLELEAGAYAFPFAGSGAFGRFGYVVPMFDTRGPSNRGWTVDAPLLVGFHYMVQSCCGITDRFLGADATASLDATYWFARYIGFAMRLTGGGAVGQMSALSRAGEPVDPKPKLFTMPIGRFAVGLAI
jgi:hypothetical protein